MSLNKKDGETQTQMATQDLTQEQVELMKSINRILIHIFTTNEESEYFESSSRLLKILASCLQSSNFHQQWSNLTHISYADQALEFSVDTLMDNIRHNKALHLDN